MMIFRDWSVWFIDNFMNMPYLNRKYPSGAEKRMKFKANFSVLNVLGCCL